MTNFTNNVLFSINNKLCNFILNENLIINTLFTLNDVLF